jgi:hypothetical protein
MAGADSKPRLPRSDIPPDFRCPYPDCQFQGKVELSYRGHMHSSHGVLYEKKGADTNSVRASLARYDTKLEELKELDQLAPWHCVALARHITYGQPFAEVVKEMPGKHSADSIRAVAKSPAGQAFLQKASENLKDPVQAVKNLMASDVFSKHMDWLQAWEWAMEAKDYEAIHRMGKDIGLAPALDSQQKAGPTKIVLNMQMGDLGATQIPTRFEMVKDAEFSVEEPEDVG